MAFCNSCGSAMEAGAKFCPKCGAAAAAGAPAAAPVVSSAPAPASGGSSALKIILIIVAVLVVLAMLVMGTCAYVVHRAVNKFHVENGKDGSVHVETPFGSVDSTQDPSEAAKNVGVDIYPGATVAKDGSANMTIGKMHTASVTLETTDSPSAVNDYYKAKFPNATLMSGQGDHYNLMAGDKNNMTTINIDTRDGKTQIHIAKITGRLGGSN